MVVLNLWHLAAQRRSGIMSAIKNAGAALLGLAIFAAIIFLSVLVFKGTAYISVIVLPYLSEIAAIATAICVIVLLPLSLFRVTRAVAFWGFLGLIPLT